MKKYLRLHTPFGLVTIGTINSYYNEFLIKQQIQYTPCIKIPIMNKANQVTYDLSETIDDFVSNSVSCIDVHLTKNLLEKYPICNDMVYDSHFIDEQLIKVVNNSLIINTMKRKEEFYKPKLELEDLHNLSIELGKKFCNRDMYAFHLELNKYQKYFIFTSSDAFKLFISGPRHENSSKIALFAEFVELYPDQWISGRYDTSVYLNELSRSSIYNG